MGLRMKSGRVWLVLGLMTLTAMLVGSAPKAAGRQTAAAATPVAGGPSTYQPVVEKYCVTCHNDRLKTGGLSLQGHDLSAVAQDAELWEKVVRKLSNGQMPPLGAPKPDAATTGQFVTTLTTTLDRAAARRPNPGHPMIHRLNRSEYANAVRDLLRLNVDVTALLPADELSSGFDNIADALGVSPLLIERYLAAADRVAATAVGDREIVAGSDTFVPRGDTQQLDHIEGLPLGTRGGLLIKQTFPLDATYVISAKLYQTNNGFTRGLAAPHDLEFSVDGERVFLNTVGGTGGLCEPHGESRVRRGGGQAIDRPGADQGRCARRRRDLRSEDRRLERVGLQAPAGACRYGGQRRRAEAGQRHDQGTVRCDGARRHSKSPADFLVPSFDRER